MVKWLKRVALAVLLVVFALGTTVFGVYWVNRDIVANGPLEAPPPGATLSGDFPPAVGWSTEQLEDARAFADSVGSSAVVAIQGGELIAEWGMTDRRISGHSVRKSLVSALYGIAVEKGLINIEATLQELGVDDEPPLTDEEKQATILDLLTSRSGIYHSSVRTDGDTPKRGTHAPGTHFFYNNWSFNALGTIFEQQSGVSMGQAFKEWIADPIDMQDFRVEDVRYEEGTESVFPAYRFWITARDLARFGVLYLQQGRWGERRIILERWITRSTTPYSTIREESPRGAIGYGFLWWTYTDGSYMATGTGGQKLLIDPSRELVVVNRVDTGEGLRRGLWWEYGPRVNNGQFLEIVRRIDAAAPPSHDPVPATGGSSP